MFIVPLSGDKVQTSGGVARVTLSFTNYKESPAIYVEGDSTDADVVSFGDIVSVNGTPVKQDSSKVLVSTGHVKRKEQLPQKDDRVVVDGESIKVKKLKLGERGNLAAGMLVVGETDDKQDRTVRIADISNIVRADGAQFSRRAFLSTYKDYLGSAA